MACRSEERAKEAMGKIQKAIEGAEGAGTYEFLQMDVSEPESGARKLSNSFSENLQAVKRVEAHENVETIWGTVLHAVKTASAEMKKRFDKLDLVVLNAGVMAIPTV